MSCVRELVNLRIEPLHLSLKARVASMGLLKGILRLMLLAQTEAGEGKNQTCPAVLVFGM